MEYDFRAIEAKWQRHWKDTDAYKVTEDADKPKHYVLDMFPYPSGAGLHVGHPLGYIASDIHARYMRHKGYNVLHPMGYDSFGLPAEQYAIQTGQHPAVTTEKNINRYREQLEQLGFCYDWSREVRTSDPSYYRWTQWIFGELFESWYDTSAGRTRPIAELVALFEANGNHNVEAACDESWWHALSFPHFGEHFDGTFTATDWASMNDAQRSELLMHFRIAYLADSEVNWCPELGTVLANDEVKDGLSERGGHPVVKKTMRQWMMRITAYADRLLNDLDELEWSDSVKEAQRHWIGRSEGAIVQFPLAEDAGKHVEVFTTRPDTLHGVAFMVLAPEHDLVQTLTSDDQRDAVEAYVHQASMKSERDRQGDKTISGVFTGGHVTHPITGQPVPVWIADYVLAGYGTGAIMAVPAGDERDWKFAKHFDLDIPNIFEGHDTDESVCTDKGAILKGVAIGMAKPLATPSPWRSIGLRTPVSDDAKSTTESGTPSSAVNAIGGSLSRYATKEACPNGSPTPPSPCPRWTRICPLRTGNRRWRGLPEKIGPCSVAKRWRRTPCPVGLAAVGISCATWTHTTKKPSVTGPKATTGVKSTCTWEVPSTPPGTCCTRGFGRSACLTWDTSGSTSPSSS